MMVMRLTIEKFEERTTWEMAEDIFKSEINTAFVIVDSHGKSTGLLITRVLTVFNILVFEEVCENTIINELQFEDESDLTRWLTGLDVRDLRRAEVDITFSLKNN
jgi:hypothetical protein